VVRVTRLQLLLLKEIMGAQLPAVQAVLVAEVAVLAV
jgi:hypothetical protein